MEYIALDAHKRYSFVSVEEHTRAVFEEARIDHRRGAIAEFLSAWKPGTSVAVETVGNWYWIVDEIEAAAMVPQLVHARRAKMMLASVNKTAKLDCHGLNRLQNRIHATLAKYAVYLEAGKRCLREARLGRAEKEAGYLVATQSILRREALGDIREATG
ncbi:MAG: hypothetical protein ABSG17_03305 [Spirochaetia bacterium]|jgi:hypothetical protein